MTLTEDQRLHIHSLSSYSKSSKRLKSYFLQTIVNEKTALQSTKSIESLQKIDEAWSAAFLLEFMLITHQKFRVLLELIQDDLAFRRLQTIFRQLDDQYQNSILNIHHFLTNNQSTFDILQKEYSMQGILLHTGMIVGGLITSASLSFVVMVNPWLLCVLIPSLIVCLYCMHKSFYVSEKQDLIEKLKYENYLVLSIEQKSEESCTRVIKQEPVQKQVATISDPNFPTLKFLGKGLINMILTEDISINEQKTSP